MILAKNWPKTAKSSWHCSFKMRIRAASIKYAKAKKWHSRQKEYILEKDISAIEKEPDQQHLSEADKESLPEALEIKRQ